ncbi:MAG TPA: D-alanyl-D-alanine carboxypeptidase, partial [Segetibacter sp.]|nr:D-alanyl-D-alanine carboxypeptidase [Segetibacter sp.]
MKRTIQIIVLLMTVGLVHGQEVYKRLQSAVKNLQGDEQLKSGVLAFSVGDQKTGNIVFSENGTTGLPAGSTQKVFTSIASLETLKGDYRYKTTLAYSGNVVDGILNGKLMIDGAGDPTLGSWRYSDTKEQVILNRWIKAIKQAGIRRINGDIIISNSWGSYTVPGGWIWDDIGNYYGAGATSVNWRENQYDLKLKSGSTGSKVAIVATNPPLYDVNLVSELTGGKAGSGDNAYIYLGPYSNIGYVRGTIPPNQNSFTVSGSFPDPAHQLKRALEEELKKQGIQYTNDSGD